MLRLEIQARQGESVDLSSMNPMINEHPQLQWNYLDESLLILYNDLLKVQLQIQFNIYGNNWKLISKDILQLIQVESYSLEEKAGLPPRHYKVNLISVAH